MRSPSGYGAPWRPRSQRSELYVRDSTAKPPPNGGYADFLSAKKIFYTWNCTLRKIGYTQNKHKTKKKNRLADVNLFAYRYLTENFSICNTFHIDATLKFYRCVISYISIKNMLHFFSKKRISIEIWSNTQKSIDY